jgi:hippurate hydrolase
VVTTPLVNDAAQVTAMAEAAEALGPVDRDFPAVMGGEDFAAMLERVPGAYILVGNGDSAEVHHPRFDFNDATIPYGAGALAALVEAKLAR